MTRIFISYRRDDSEPFALALREELELRFGAGSVFLDTSSIDVGTNFPRSIETALREASTCLVLIGRRWLSITDADGRPRLQHDGDWVRREVRTALAESEVRGMRVIPVLLNDTRMPEAADLPPDLKGLPDQGGFSLFSVARDAMSLADIIERRHPVLEPAMAMALAAGLGLWLRSWHLSVSRGLPLNGLHEGSVGVTRWFLEMAGNSVYYALLVLGVLVAVRSRTGWRMADMTRVAACAALGVAVAHTATTPLLAWLGPLWQGAGALRIATWFAGAVCGTGLGIERFAPTLRITRKQWLRPGVAVILMGSLGSLLQGWVVEGADSGAWMRNPRTALWGPVLLGFAALWQSKAAHGAAAKLPAVPWRTVASVLGAMVLGDALAVATSPWLEGSPAPESLTLIQAKEAWNHAMFFGLLAGVMAWRLNRDTVVERQ